MGKRGNVVRGNFGRARQDRLAFWPPAPRKPMWKRYVPLWLGAALLGGTYGSGLLNRKPVPPPAAARPMETVGIAEAVEDGVDRQWRTRSDDSAAVAPAATAAVSFGLCHAGGGTNCVVDGDTIWFQGEKIRIADIDTPETHEPRCAEELALGNQATQRLHQLVNSGSVTLQSIDRDEDKYGRKLRLVLVNGASVGDTLVGEGLARWYEGGRKSWCG